jgi:glycosyltransferase involved in cell wall biosynthesis
MTMPAASVSVVIPCFDQGRYLGEAIASALAQVRADVEVIVVDDGSTDETPRVAAAHPSVRYIRQANAGTAAARNRGLREARGELVLFLDADDRLRPDAIATGAAWLEAHPGAAFVAGHVWLIDADGVAGPQPVQDHEAPGYAALLRDNWIWTPGVVLYRRDAVEAAGGFDAGAGGSADYDLNVRLARRHAFGCHHQIVLDYRQHAASMTRDPAYMLRSAVAVRRRERRHAVRLGVRDAWRAGLRAVQADFGGRLVDRVKGDILRGRYLRALRGLVSLARFYPAGLSPRSSAWTRRHRWGM